MSRPLNVLMILHMPWTANLGGPRVQLELAEEFRRLGHTVDKFDINDAFPHRNHLSSFFHQALFHQRASRFVRENGAKYDVIDAHQGNLPFSKSHLRFRNLLCTRSAGLVHFHARSVREAAHIDAAYRKRKGSLGGNSLRWIARSMHSPIRQAEKSFAASDLIILHNEDERDYVAHTLGYHEKSVHLPAGLTERRFVEFSACAAAPLRRISDQQIVFIGRWSTLKGSRDWPKIISRVRAQVPGARFLFLGTGCSSTDVLADLGRPACDWITVVPHFTSEELPELVSRATVGAFPSYTEGFGIAVLEKLAAGLPTVAYDIPGPREMLRHFDTPLMVPLGDVDQFSDRLVWLLRLDEATYTDLSQHCVRVAHLFSWHRIATELLHIYEQALERCGR
jgi:glycosyltransferase involved in cell wall biosynthesis